MSGPPLAAAGGEKVAEKREEFVDSDGRRGRVIRLAVEGCAHGDLDTIYDALRAAAEVDGRPVDALLCCGDFQAVRNEQDLETMSCPLKYRSMQSFYRYYSGERHAPVLTLFVGGNHESSAYLEELPYGGWAAPGIYYMGRAGSVWLGGLRICGWSGIFQSAHYARGHTERWPLSDRDVKSVYHTRWVEGVRLAMLGHWSEKHVDIMMTHDWPAGVTAHGDEAGLLRFKPRFREDIERGQLGSPAAMELLSILRPRYWFSAHMHCQFLALVNHEKVEIEPPSPKVKPPQKTPSEDKPPQKTPSEDKRPQKKSSIAPPLYASDGAKKQSCGRGPARVLRTRFLALDKPLPGRSFIQIVDVVVWDDEEGSSPLQLSYDSEWLAILRSTHGLSGSPSPQKLPSPELVRECTRDMRAVVTDLGYEGGTQDDRVPIPPLFRKTATPFECPDGFDPKYSQDACIRNNMSVAPHFRKPWGYPGPQQSRPPKTGNPQTDLFLYALGLEHVETVPFDKHSIGPQEPIMSLTSHAAAAAAAQDDDEIDIDI